MHGELGRVWMCVVWRGFLRTGLYAMPGSVTIRQHVSRHRMSGQWHMRWIRHEKREWHVRMLRWVRGRRYTATQAHRQSSSIACDVMLIRDHIVTFAFLLSVPVPSSSSSSSWSDSHCSTCEAQSFPSSHWADGCTDCKCNQQDGCFWGSRCDSVCQCGMSVRPGGTGCASGKLGDGICTCSYDGQSCNPDGGICTPTGECVCTKPGFYGEFCEASNSGHAITSVDTATRTVRTQELNVCVVLMFVRCDRLLVCSSAGALITTFLVLIGLSSLYLGWNALPAHYQKWLQKDVNDPVRLNLVNAVGVFSAIVEIIQMCAFAFNHSIPCQTHRDDARRKERTRCDRVAVCAHTLTCS
jgi:hypothetical protein